MLKFNQVSKSFGSIVALENVNLGIDEGEFVFITGASGAGKTTLLRLILRELLPDTGEVFLDDTDITKLPKKKIPSLRQNIGVIFQDFKVLPERTLEENVAVALAVSGIERSEWKNRIDQVLELVKLSDRRSLFPSQLSGGELQRTSLARALVVNPKIILADEPTGNLDWDTADEMMDLLRNINSEGKTILVSTHHRGIVDKFGKRVVELEKGKVKKDSGKTKNKKESTKDKESSKVTKPKDDKMKQKQ